MQPSILDKLKLIQENPGYYNGLTAEEQAEIFLFLLQPKKLFRKPKVLNGKDGKDGKTPVKDVDFLSKERSLKFLDDIQKQVETRLESIVQPENGKDAEVTPELIEDIVLEVTERVDIPEYVPYDDTSIKESIDAIALDHEELRDEVEELKKLPRQVINNGSGGGAQVNWVKSYVTDALSGISVTGVAEQFETVSKNLASYPYSFTYSGGKIASITYTTGGGTIVKTFNYTGSNVTSLVLSGDTPPGIDLTKTLSYTGENPTSVTYS